MFFQIFCCHSNQDNLKDDKNIGKKVKKAKKNQIWAEK